MTSREAFHAYIVAETGRTPETWRSKGIVPEGIDPDAYVMGSDQREWRAWQASRQQAMEEKNQQLAVLASFAHEILMGAYKPTVEMWKARAALERVGLMSLDDVVALTSPITGHEFKQPGWHHVAAAFVDGAREARANPEADDALFIRAADGYTKRVHEEVDPETERRLRENDWPTPTKGPAP